MDPLDSIMNGENPQVTQRRTATIKEMQRRANDRIRVYNPTLEDFKVMWDVTGAGGVWTVPARTNDRGFGPGQIVVPRYIATHYVKHMTDKILGDKQVKALREINKERVTKGMRPLDRWEGTPESQDLVLAQYKTDNKDERAKIFQILWLGVEEKYASETIAQGAETQVETRTIDEQILDSMNKTAKPLTEFPTLDDLDQNLSVEGTPVDFKPIERETLTAKDELNSMNFMKLKQEARRRGIPVDLKTKKDELLAKMTQE